MSQHVAIQTDEPAVRTVDGGVEITGHVPGDVPRFSVVHAPAEATRGLVVCSPVYAEFLQNYGREVRLARRLLDGGIATARFHYRGSGDSGGATADMTLETMVDDALAIADHLTATAGVEGLDVLGTRVGGHVAAALAAAIPGARLVVWEPVPAMGRYFDEVFRARRMVGVASAADGGSSSAAMIEELTTSGVLDVVGYEVHRRLYESLLDHTIPDLLSDGRPTDVLLVQTSRTGTIKGPVARLGSALEAAGHDVQIESVPPGEGWWIHDYDEDKSPAGRRDAEQQLLSATEAWVRSTP